MPLVTKVRQPTVRGRTFATELPDSLRRRGAAGVLVDERDGRPDDCDCIPVEKQHGTPLTCWPCRREGFTSVNPDTE